MDMNPEKQATNGNPLAAEVREAGSTGSPFARLERLASVIRQRPGTALVLALSAGFVVGRLVRR